MSSRAPWMARLERAKKTLPQFNDHFRKNQHLKLKHDRRNMKMNTQPGAAKTGGLEGIIVGDTAISTVGKEGVGLTYRGYDIHDLAAKSTFEETAYLLIHGELPTSTQLQNYREK